MNSIFSSTSSTGTSAFMYASLSLSVIFLQGASRILQVGGQSKDEIDSFSYLLSHQIHRVHIHDHPALPSVLLLHRVPSLDRKGPDLVPLLRQEQQMEPVLSAHPGDRRRGGAQEDRVLAAHEAADSVLRRPGRFAGKGFLRALDLDLDDSP